MRFARLIGLWCWLMPAVVIATNEPPWWLEKRELGFFQQDGVSYAIGFTSKFNESGQMVDQGLQMSVAQGRARAQLVRGFAPGYEDVAVRLSRDTLINFSYHFADDGTYSLATCNERCTAAVRRVVESKYPPKSSEQIGAERTERERQLEEKQARKREWEEELKRRARRAEEQLNALEKGPDVFWTAEQRSAASALFSSSGRVVLSFRGISWPPEDQERLEQAIARWSAPIGMVATEVADGEEGWKLVISLGNSPYSEIPSASFELESPDRCRAAERVRPEQTSLNSRNAKDTRRQRHIEPLAMTLVVAAFKEVRACKRKMRRANIAQALRRGDLSEAPEITQAAAAAAKKVAVAIDYRGFKPRAVQHQLMRYLNFWGSGRRRLSKKFGDTRFKITGHVEVNKLGPKDFEGKSDLTFTDQEGVHSFSCARKFPSHTSVTDLARAIAYACDEDLLKAFDKKLAEDWVAAADREVK
ncbi:MAG: hypothetical protein AAF654_10160 [Myxococcota bacterium]